MQACHDSVMLAGFPKLTIDQWAPLVIPGKQLRTAVIVFLVDFLESISIAKAVARKHDYEIIVGREIVAMGLANIFGGMFNAYTTTGSFSRSAVASEIGAKTQLQGVISGTTRLTVRSRHGRFSVDVVHLLFRHGAADSLLAWVSVPFFPANTPTVAADVYFGLQDFSS
jgi:hypothetical protein